MYSKYFYDSIRWNYRIRYDHQIMVIKSHKGKFLLAFMVKRHQTFSLDALLNSVIVNGTFCTYKHQHLRYTKL